MIRIEITDPHTLAPETLRATASYLLHLSGENVHRHPETSAPVASDTSDYKSIRIDWDAPAPTEIEQHEPDIIEEELIPVPPEVVHIPEACPPNAAEIFKPVVVDGVELDTQGYPWDARIHGRTKTKMKDGTWKKLRGVDSELVQQVEMQLRSIRSIRAPIADVVPPAIPTIPVMSQEVPAVVEKPGFVELMNLVTQSITAGKLTRVQVLSVIEPMGIPSLPLVSTRPDLIPGIMDALQGVIDATC